MDVSSSRLYVIPDAVDAVEGAWLAWLRAVEELECVCVEGESLEQLDGLVGEDPLQMEDVHGGVHHGSDCHQDGEESDDGDHGPVSRLDWDLEKRRKRSNP